MGLRLLTQYGAVGQLGHVACLAAGTDALPDAPTPLPSATPRSTYPQRVRFRASCAALTILLVGVLAALGALAAPSPSPSPTPGISLHSVPPPAPRPTDGGNSPALPDPHPPLGGRGPDGEPVGGARLLHRASVLPAKVAALPPDLTARAFVLADLDTGDILAARDPHGRYQPASIQKVLTAVTLLPLLPGNRTVIASRAAAQTEGSHAGLVAGGRYTVDELFRGLLLVSGNDTAEALAEAAGGRAKTVALMNATAQRLRAYDTFVQTPSGLDGWQQLTSAYDMTLFLRAALDEPRFAAYDTTIKTSLPAQHAAGFDRVPLYNQNVQFLRTVKGALVAKTGFTDAAQHTFVGAIERGGHRYGVVLMRAQRYPDDQWVQATKLVNWGLKLPKGTRPVGQLAAPTGTASDATVTGTERPSGSATPGAPGSGDSGSGSTGLRILLVVALFGGMYFLTQRLRRPPAE